MWQKIVNFYNTNTYFHSLVIALEYAAVGFLSSWSGGIPTSKSGWLTLGAAFLGAIVAALKRWLQNNVATVNVKANGNK